MKEVSLHLVLGTGITEKREGDHIKVSYSEGL